MNVSVAMLLVAAAFGSLTFLIEKTEQKAKTCSVHNRKAGKIARILGFCCGLTAACLVVGAFLMRDL